jgi:hypothetical protein
MRRAIVTVAVTGLAIALGCGVEALDLSDKTCPCDEGAGWTCDTFTNKCVPKKDCAGKTCADLGLACDGTDDGCGNFIQCGDCPDKVHEQCVANQCQCTPTTTCASVGAECGEVPVGCGSPDSLDCKQCPPPQVCGGGGDHKCGTAPCTPRTCGADCGDISDGCNSILHSTPCACTPTKTCAKDYAGQCGTFTNGCTGTVTCACDGTRRCNGDKKCCYTCESLGWVCGDGSDGCGGTLHCGGCESGTCNVTTHKC